MKIFLAIILVMSANAFALEVDEKLTVRIIRTSETRKTIMINRGTEDGLVEGDHAKFVVTSGIVARAVCVQVSPSRSVWSVYRLVNADFMINDSVMSIKITPPVKMTKDETKALVEEDTPSVASGDPMQLGIPLAEGASDLPQNLGADEEGSDRSRVEALAPVIITEKDVEIFGMLNISGLSAKTQKDSGTDAFNSSQSYHHIGLGGELYPIKEREWYSNLSLVGNLNLMRLNNQVYNGSTSTNEITEFSFGANWHPTKLPSTTLDFIPYFHFSFNLGSILSSYTAGSEGGGATNELSANGGTQGFSLGFGYKYYLADGLGIRVLLDYYSRTETYEADDQTNKFNKVVSGPRFMIGLGKRF
jgi:hypothetical protein